MSKSSVYEELKPSIHLENFIHSFWTHNNAMNVPEEMTITPDSFFKIIFFVQEGRIINYFITGIWTEHKEFIIPANTSSYGCRLKILAPEFLLNKEIANLLDSLEPLDLTFLNINQFDISSFSKIVEQWETELTKLIIEKPIQENKLRLSKFLYNKNECYSATEVSNQVFWSNRQINRYLKKYIGISLKKYLNVQKCYASYIHIREGKLFPGENYFDQAHFIREIKKHTGETPKSLFLKKNDRFIQLKNIQER